MADLKTESIAISKIKVRWEEPYVSEGVNRQMTGFPPGIYRGGQIAPASTPDLTFEVGPDVEGSGLFTDSFYVYRDSANGFALAVNDAADVSFDMSARFTDPGPAMPGDETWWVWLEVDYATSNPTTANYKVTDTTPPDDAVVIGKIEMLSGDTAIIEARFVRTVRTEPIPAKRKDGAYVAGDEWIGFLSGEEAWNIPTSAQKDALNAASTPTTSNPLTTYNDFLGKYVAQPTMETKTINPAGVKFQLNTNVYVKESKASAGDFARWLKVFPDDWTHADGDKPLVGSDGQQIPVLRLLRSDGTTPLVAGDADTNGFYQNPYVELDFSNTVDSTYSGNLKVFYFKRQLHNVVWGETPKSMMPFEWFQQRYHTNKVVAPNATGSPESLSTGTLTSQLVALLGFINDRIETINPTSNPTTPVLVWRSHGITSDANVTGKTTSLYVSNDGLFFIGGGYMNSSGEIVPAPVSPIGVSMIMLSTSAMDNGPVFATIQVPGGNLDPADSADWDSYMLNSPGLGFDFKKGEIRLETGFNLKAKSGSSIVAESGSSVVSDAGSTVDISGDVDLEDGSTLEAKDGSEITLEDGSSLSADSGSNIYAYSGSSILFQGDTTLNATSLDLDGGSGASDAVGYIKGQDTSHYRLLFDSNGVGSLSPKIYYSENELWIVSNAYYDSANSRWNKGPQNNTDACAICFSGGTIKFYSESHYASDWTTGYWTTWTREHRWMMEAYDKTLSATTYAYNCAVSYGEVYERIKYSVGGKNLGSASNNCMHTQGYNFRNKYASGPLYQTRVTEGSDPNLDNIVIYNADNWGFHIYATSNVIAANALWYGEGYYHVY